MASEFTRSSIQGAAQGQPKGLRLFSCFFSSSFNRRSVTSCRAFSRVCAALSFDSFGVSAACITFTMVSMAAPATPFSLSASFRGFVFGLGHGSVIHSILYQFSPVPRLFGRKTELFLGFLKIRVFSLFVYRLTFVHPLFDEKRSPSLFNVQRAFPSRVFLAFRDCASGVCRAFRGLGRSVPPS